MVDDVLVNNEAHMVTSSILRFAGPTQFFKSAHWGKMCVYTFIGGECVLIYVSVYVCN
jgi:hypothetical protein